MVQIEARYAEDILATVSQPIVVLTGDLRVEMVNDAFCNTFEVTAEGSEERLIYDLGNGQWDIPELRKLLHEVLSDRNSVHDYRVEHDFEQIGERIMLLNARRMARDGGDRIVLTINDITERERERYELEGRREFAEKLVDSVREGLLILGWDLRVHSANGSFYEQFRVKPEETEGRMVYELGNGQWDIPELRDLLEKVLPEKSTFNDYEVEHEFEHIGRRIMVLNGRRLDHLNLIILAIRDVTERRAHERRQQAFMSELQHRVKNILNNVRSLARQTRRRSTDLDQFFDRFLPRLDALARAQNLLLKSPDDDLDLSEIVDVELEAVGAERGRTYTAEGPPLRLRPRDAQAIAMAVHELATNAGKLRRPAVGDRPHQRPLADRPGERRRDPLRLAGAWCPHRRHRNVSRVRIGSDREERAAHAGGNRTPRPAPRRRGVPDQLPDARKGAMMDQFLKGRRLLVLEDDYLAALDVQEMLEDLGATIIGPVGRLDQAQELVRSHAIDGAVLDVKLDSKTSYPLARELLAAGIAVVFLTGYARASMDAEFRDVPRVSKPFDNRHGEGVLRKAFG